MANRKLNEYIIENGIVHVKLRRSDKEVLCDIADWERLKHITWFYDSGYAKSMIFGKRVMFHRMVMNAPVEMEVDHINHNTLDNRRENLRVVSHIVNMANRGLQTNNKTGMNGVSFMKSNSRYYAQINVNGKRMYLGCYKTIEEAKEARLKAEKEYKDPYIEQGTLR